MSRRSFEVLLESATREVGLLTGESALSNPISISDTDWLIDGTMLPPVPEGMVTRVDLESALVDALGNFGVGVLTGSSGLGKSIVSRSAALNHFGTFHLIEFRNIETNETRHLLDIVFARMASLPSSALILDDLNQIDDAHVRLSLARVINASKRNNRVVLITCHRRPSLTTLANIGLDLNCVVECPYFSEEEVRTLVHANGGCPEKWGRIAYIAGASGHPQLTHAFVNGMATRQWPAGGLRNFVSRGMSTDDIDAVRDDARRILISRLPEETRNLLYRLSLTIGRFSRSMALTLGEIPSAIGNTGECLDQLIGPWIESVGDDSFRVSPLASNTGREMLSPYLQQTIHESFAVQMLKKRTIDARDADTILAHAILGKSPQSLLALAQSVLSADPRNVEMLSEQFLLLRFSQVDAPILPEDPFVSGIVRLAQFKLTAAAGEVDQIARIATVFFEEIRSIPAGKLRSALEAMAVITVLGTRGVANYLDNWVTLLLEFKTSARSNAFLQDVIAGGLTDLEGLNYLDALFDIGSTDLTSIERLEHVVNELDKLEERERALLLTQIDGTLSDFSVLINGTWAAQTNRDGFDASDAAFRYRRMAKRTHSWGIRTFSLQCSVAQAVILDEHENKKDRAVAVLNEAATAIGDDPILQSALANIRWRHHEYQAAFEIYRNVVDHVGGTDPAERAFLLRKAAMSAAKCDEWTLAATWFLNAQRAANSAHGETMNAFAIGLGADSAVAAFKAGNVGQALRRFGDALKSLADIDPETTLQSRYCHLVIRQAVLWVQTQIEGTESKIGEQPMPMEAGCCSNTSPSSAIRDLPLAHIDIAWYMLARAETAGGCDAGIKDKIGGILADGSIPPIEMVLRTNTIQADIDRLDFVRFAAHFIPYLESAVYASEEVGQLATTFDPLAPKRGEIPTLDENPPFDPSAEQAASDAIIAYGIMSCIKDQPSTLTELENVVEGRFPGSFPGKPVFDYWNSKSGLLTEINQTVVAIAKALLGNEHVNPHVFWNAGLRFFEWANQSRFKGLLTARLAAWQRSGWKRILTTETFRLSSPRQTVPPIEEVLARPQDDRAFVARLLLVTSEAVESRLASAYRRSLESMTRDEDLPVE